MKKHDAFMTKGEHAAAKKPNGPLRTFTEVAEDLGLAPNGLRRIFGTSPVPPPEPFVVHVGKLSGRHSYYELHAMRAWWKAHNAAKE